MLPDKQNGAKTISCQFTDGECAHLIAIDKALEAPLELRDRARRLAQNTYCPNCPYRPRLTTLPNQPE